MSSQRTVFFDGTCRDIAYALRGFKRAPLASLTIVATVGLGLGLVAVVFTFLNAFVFSVDHVPNVDEMYGLERPQSSTGERPFTRAQLDALRRETTVFTDAYAEVTGIDFPVDGRTMLFTFTTGNFFQVVGVNAALGRTLTPSDDEPSAGRAVMVLSHRGWDRLFSHDPGVVGRRVAVKGTSFEIVGVMPEGFRGLSVVPPDYWVPLSMLGHVTGRENELNVDLRIIGRLRPGITQATAVAGLNVWASASSRAASMEERAASAITLTPRRGTVPQRLQAMLVTVPLFFAFGLILLIGCANVTNLLLARGIARQREIGIRLSLGAARGRLIRQLLTESLFLALAAAAIGFAISRVALHAIVQSIMTSWPPEIGDVQLVVPGADWRVVLFLVVTAVLATVFFGLAPALQATRIEPIRTLRGEIVRDARPGRARDFLIGVQVSASALLLICAALFLRSAFAATTVNPGMRISDTLTIEIANEKVRTPIIQVVTTEPSVALTAASWPSVMEDPKPALGQTTVAKSAIGYRFVSPEFFSVLDIALVRGRTFTANERMASLAIAVISETTARTLWPNGEPIGQIVRLDPDPKSDPRRADEPSLEPRTVAVIGVVRDVPGFRIAPLPKAVVYLPTSAAMPKTALVARAHGDPDLTRLTLEQRLAKLESDISHVGAMRWVTRVETYFLQLGFWLTVGLGVLALMLTLSGLFSVLSYLVEQRTREIGVRMALGATTRHVTQLVLSQSIRPIGLGLVMGGGCAAGLSRMLLATPAAAMIGQIVQVVDPVAYMASLLIIIAACLAAAAIPASRAARLDPTQTLRQE